MQQRMMLQSDVFANTEELQHCNMSEAQGAVRLKVCACHVSCMTRELEERQAG